jgi:outer membrane murein-binding lipoprotein Lpp
VKATIALVVGGLMLAGCSNLSPTQNAALGGTAAGGSSGAGLGVGFGHR